MPGHAGIDVRRKRSPVAADDAVARCSPTAGARSADRGGCLLKADRRAEHAERTSWSTRCRSGRLAGGLGSAAEHQPGQPPHLNDGSGPRLLVISPRLARSPRLQELAVSFACSLRVVLAGLHEVFLDAHCRLPACH
jgi:hypothetical protein